MALLSRSAVLAHCRVSRLPRRPDVSASPSLRFGVLAQVLSRAEGMVCECRGVGRAAGERRSNTDRGRVKRRNSFEIRESENSQKAKVHFPLSFPVVFSVCVCVLCLYIKSRSTDSNERV